MIDTITLIANVSLSLSFIVALIFGVAQVKATRRDRRERLTMDALRNFQTKEFAELIYFITSTTLISNQEEFLKRPKEEQISFIQFGQKMESLGILVAEKFININLVDKTLGSFVTTAWEKYKPMYLDIREKTTDPFLAEYFQWLAETIEKRMKENPRKPFKLQDK
ncbi:MAG: DUF4760 domain-containing protein [Janthinobacterium lividum]